MALLFRDSLCVKLYDQVSLEEEIIISQWDFLNKVVFVSTVSTGFVLLYLSFHSQVNISEERESWMTKFCEITEPSFP